MDFAEIDDRIAKCNKILDENPNSQIFAALAEAYRRKGQLDQAFRVCQNGLRVHPNYVSAHLVMARINLDKGMFDWAEIEVNKAVILEGASFNSDLLMAEINIRRGEIAKASKLLEKLHQMDAGNKQVQKLMELCQTLPREAAEQIKQPLKKESSVSEKPVLQTAAPKAVPAHAGGAMVKEGRISIRDFLDVLVQIEGVMGILLVNNEGLVAEARWKDTVNQEEFGALAREIEAEIQKQLGHSQFVNYESLLIESPDLVINMIPLKESMLIIKATGRINLGTLRLKMSSLFGRLDEDYLK